MLPNKWAAFFVQLMIVFGNIPALQYFVPSKNIIEVLPGNILKLEELEAIRLKDFESLEQDKCADRIEIQN